MKNRTKGKPMDMQPGYDGAIVMNADAVKISATRFEARPIRCRPGSFEAEYGRKRNRLALYHAGMQFSTLWEKAHITVPTPDLERTGSAGWRGLPDGRVAALTKIKRMSETVGRYSMNRLVDYCIIGSTTAEMAGKYNSTRRAMASVLEMDLRAAASHFGSQ
jgi:hypothetical protein